MCASVRLSITHTHTHTHSSSRVSSRGNDKPVKLPAPSGLRVTGKTQEHEEEICEHTHKERKEKKKKKKKGSAKTKQIGDRVAKMSHKGFDVFYYKYILKKKSIKKRDRPRE